MRYETVLTQCANASGLLSPGVLELLNSRTGLAWFFVLIPYRVFELGPQTTSDAFCAAN